MSSWMNRSCMFSALAVVILCVVSIPAAAAQGVDASQVRPDTATSDSALRALAVALEESRARAAKEVDLLQQRVDSANARLREEITRGAKSDAASQAATKRLFAAFDERLRALEARDSVARISARDSRLGRLIAGERLAARLRDDGRILSTAARAIALSAKTTALSNPFTYDAFVQLKDSLITTFAPVQRPLLLGLIDRVRENYAQQPVASALDPLVTLLVGPKWNKKRQLEVYEWQREFLCVATASKALADRQHALAALTATLQIRSTELRVAADSSLNQFRIATGYSRRDVVELGYEAYLRDLARTTPTSFDAIRSDAPLFAVGSVASKFEEVSHAASAFVEGYRQFIQAAQDLGKKCASISGPLVERAMDVRLALDKLEEDLAPAIRDGADPSAITRTQLLAALQAR